MLQQFYRTSILLDDAKINELTKKHVLVAGVGGVGGYAVEALVRAGIGQITIIDNDTVDITNINRQLIALLPDVGRVKVELFRERIKLINPQCSVYTITEFLDENNVDKFIPCSVDYVIDCIDTVDSKVSLIKYCY
ncbi:MAG TPA: ThiF family adenylyltransferase, partial [Burkholderiales bacterium]|nr:ThiF family adenylyltransferase [Burkholderiales bacterium]